MRLAERLIARDQAADASARALGEHVGLYRGAAHRELLIAHLAHLIEGDGVDAVGGWLEDVLDNLAAHHGLADG